MNSQRRLRMVVIALFAFYMFYQNTGHAGYTISDMPALIAASASNPIKFLHQSFQGQATFRRAEYWAEPPDNEQAIDNLRKLYPAVSPLIHSYWVIFNTPNGPLVCPIRNPDLIVKISHWQVGHPANVSGKLHVIVPEAVQLLYGCTIDE